MKILFLCVANSARSQIAEGLARHVLGNQAQIYSAGSSPSSLNPYAVTVLAEWNIDISAYTSKSVHNFQDITLDFVITLCAEQVCPVYLKSIKTLHWGFFDPAKIDASDTSATTLQKFREVRDGIHQKITAFKSQNFS